MGARALLEKVKGLIPSPSDWWYRHAGHVRYYLVKWGWLKDE